MTNRRATLGGVLVLVLALAAASWGQSATGKNAANSDTSPAAKEMIQLSFPENVEVKVLIEYVSKRLSMNILYDEAVGRKQITISSPARIPKDSLLGLLRSVLKMSGLMLIDAEQAGWKKVVPSVDLIPLTEIQPDPGKLAEAPKTTAITQVFQLRHVATAEVEKTIRPFLGKPGGNSFAIPEQNMLLVTDYAGNLRKIASLIEMVDKAGPKASVRFVPVKHLDAGELARQVTALLREEDRIGGVTRDTQRRLALTPEPRTNQIVVISTEDLEARALALIEKLDVPVEIETRTYRLRHVAPQRIEKLARELVSAEKLKDRYKSVIDAESGLLIVTAPPEVHETIGQLKRDLDVALAEEESHVRFYKLMNTTAATVLATIRSLEGGEKGLEALAQLAEEPTPAKKETRKPFTGPNVPPPPVGEELPKPPAYQPSTAPAKESSQGNPDGATGRITAKTKDAIVTADPNTNTLIVVAPPPVQDIYKKLIAMLDKRRPQVLVEVILVTLDTSEGFSLGVELSRAELNAQGHDYLVFSSFGLSEIDPATGMLTFAPGVGFNGVLLAPGTVNVVVQALASSGRSEVLAAPRVLVNDNASATLASVSEAPFTSINASDTVSTTSFAGYAQAGTTVTVTPHISEGDHLLLDYSITLNSFTGTGAAGIPPPRQTDSLSSNVTIPDGYTVIVGGLTRKDASESVSKVPFLGDIPILKYLVSIREENESQSTLFVFIRPLILRDDQFEDLKYLSDRDLGLARMPGNFPLSHPLIMQ